jgi:hypothetical protein
VKEDITEQLRPQKLEAMIEDLKKSNPTTLDEGFFGPPAPAPGQPGQPGQPPARPAQPIER